MGTQISWNKNLKPLNWSIPWKQIESRNTKEHMVQIEKNSIEKNESGLVQIEKTKKEKNESGPVQITDLDLTFYTQHLKCLELIHTNINI